MTTEEMDDYLLKIAAGPKVCIDANLISHDPVLVGWITGAAYVLGTPIIYYNWSGEVPDLKNHTFLSGDLNVGELSSI